MARLPQGLCGNPSHQHDTQPCDRADQPEHQAVICVLGNRIHILIAFAAQTTATGYENIVLDGHVISREQGAGKELTVPGCRHGLVICRHMYAYLLLYMLMKRTALFLKEQQLAKLQALSEKTGAPIAELVRRAIDSYLAIRKKELKKA